MLRKHQKLGMRYFGPFRVLERIGSVAYRLDLLATTRIHPVFHVSLLKRCHGSIPAAFIPLPLLTAPKGPLSRPTEILGTCSIQHGTQAVSQLLVRWDDDAAPSWESVSFLQTHYPDFDLGDKVTLVGEGNVMNDTVNGEEHAEDSSATTIQARDSNGEGLHQSTREKRVTWKLRE